MGSIDEKSLELEVKHKVDGSWNPCRVSFSTADSKFGIVVNPANSNEEDVISNREDVVARLRFRSSPLQGGECSNVKEGDCVLAMYKDQFRCMFFDAMIEKLKRVKHSNRVFCRCTFEIKWLNPELKDQTMTIPSKSIMKLSGKEIDSHPVVAAFLNSLSPTEGAEPSSFLSLLEETNYEVDVEGILEKQIEEISKLADGSMECSLDILEVKRASHGGRKQSKGAISSNSKQNNTRRSTRSQNKEQLEVEPKKVVEDNKPFLSPLAARAALASLIHEHELPMNSSLMKKEGQEDFDQKYSKGQIKMHSLDMNYEYVRCGGSSKGNTLDLSNLIRDGDNDTHQNGVNPAIYTSIGSTNAGRLSVRSTATRVTRSSANKDVEVLSADVKCQSSKKKLSSPLNTTRKTRTSMHKEIEDSSDGVKREYSIGNDTRLTRSRNQKEQSNTRDVSEESEGKKGSSATIVNNSIGFAQSDLIQDGDNGAHQNDAKDNITVNASIGSTNVGRLSGRSPTTRVNRSSANKGDVKCQSSKEKLIIPVNSTRKTCSSMHKEMEALSDEVKNEYSIGNDIKLTRSRNQKEQSSTDGISEESEGKKGGSSTIVNNLIDLTSAQSTTRRVTRTSALKETEAPSDVAKQESSSNKGTSSTARSTRAQNQTIDKVQDTTRTSEDAARGKSKSKKRSIESHVDPNKRIRASHGVTVTTEESGAILEDNGDASNEKKKIERKKATAPEKPNLRSSPRFTRSQS